MRTYWIVVRNTEPLSPAFLKPRGGWTKNNWEARKFGSKAEVWDAMTKAKADNPAESIGYCRFISKADTRRW